MVTKWFADKGYGFCHYSNDDEVFVHIKEIRQPINSAPLSYLAIGDRIEFGISKDKGGRTFASDVTLLEDA